MATATTGDRDRVRTVALAEDLGCDGGVGLQMVPEGAVLGA